MFGCWLLVGLKEVGKPVVVVEEEIESTIPLYTIVSAVGTGDPSARVRNNRLAFIALNVNPTLHALLFLFLPHLSLTSYQ